MRKLMYLFEDGTTLSTYTEALTYREETGLKWVEDLVEVKLYPERDITDGVDFYKGSSLKEIAGLKRIDLSNVAKRGYFLTTEKDVLARTLEDNPWLPKVSREVK